QHFRLSFLTCRFFPKNVVHHFPASTLAIASTVLRSRDGRRPTPAGLPFRFIGAVFFVFPMVVFGLRTTLLAINPRIPWWQSFGGALTNHSHVAIPWLNFVAVVRWAPALHTLPRRLPGLRGRPGKDPRS